MELTVSSRPAYHVLSVLFFVFLEPHGELLGGRSQIPLWITGGGGLLLNEGGSPEEELIPKSFLHPPVLEVA